jgi:hypothetical protein
MAIKILCVHENVGSALFRIELLGTGDMSRSACRWMQFPFRSCRSRNLSSIWQQNKHQKRNDRKCWLIETHTACAVLMQVKHTMWRCRKCLFAAKRFLGAIHFQGHLKLTHGDLSENAENFRHKQYTCRANWNAINLGKRRPRGQFTSKFSRSSVIQNQGILFLLKAEWYEKEVHVLRTSKASFCALLVRGF